MLGDKITTGVLWNFAEQSVRRGISIAVTLLLAFFLTPEDFGLLAMMAIFLSLATNLMDSGFKDALIRFKVVTQADLNTAFFSNIVLGVFAYFLLFISAPFISGFYGEARLLELVRVVGWVVIFNAFYVVQVAILSRELDFRAQLRATLPASLAAGVIAVFMGFMGYGVWSLIAQLMVSSFLASVLLWKQSSWRPTLSVSYYSFRKIFNFGYKLFLSGLLAILAKNIFSLAIAKFYSATVAGLYFLVEKMLDILMNQLVYAIQNVTYPALSSIQDDDQRLKAVYRKVLSVITFLVFPILLLMTALAEPLFQFVFPERWWPATVYFQIMCIGFLLYPLHVINLNMLKVKGRSDLFLKLEVIKVAIAMVLLLSTIAYGVEFVLIGKIVSSIIAYFLNSYYSVKFINYSVREQFADFLPTLGISLFIAVIAYSMQAIIEWKAVFELIILSLFSISVYLLLAYYFRLNAYVLIRNVIFDRYKAS